MGNFDTFMIISVTLFKLELGFIKKACLCLKYVESDAEGTNHVELRKSIPQKVY